jgi:UDP-galactopyranose mutase
MQQHTERVEKSELFQSFWQAGFEGADHVNSSGQALVLADLSGHLRHLDADYEALAPFGMRCVRESAGWRYTTRACDYDFSCVRRRAEAAARRGLQILWTCCHYGVPDDVDPFDARFVSRFARYCEALARCLAPYQADCGHAAVYTPINEISFYTWALCETGLMHPFRGDRQEQSHALKMRLVEASLAGAEAIRQVNPSARFLHVDPLIHIAAPVDRPDLAAAAARMTAHQFDAWDMLCGLSEPQLGGSPAHLDIVGINYYYPNQWEWGSNARLHWHAQDPRRRPLRDMLAEVAARYPVPLTIAETSHLGSGRGRWIEDIADEVRAVRDAGIDLRGICLYPAVSRPDWEQPAQWHASGLWDVDVFDPALPRRLHEGYAFSLRRAQACLAAPLEVSIEKDVDMPTLIVFSHLRWDFVFQRPQHLLSRLARRWNILFVEEPVLGQSDCAEILTPAPRVRVLRPHTTVQAPGFHDEQMQAVAALLSRQLRRDGIDDYVVWFYTPMAVPLLDGLEPRAIVYDCMDELSAFANAPAQLLLREATLLRVANVVFTGGPSLYESKRHLHPAVHCFPSSVDVAHFSLGRNALCAHPALAALPRPRLGFFGVIDERFDAPLVAELARQRPDWQICLVGPVVKIDPATLPRAENIHYFPQQAYEALPSFLAGWDVCLLPFARNQATRFISPTKTLEYLAADKPVVSTPIADVASLYGEVVSIAGDAEAFIAACESALAAPAAARIERARRLLATTSWDVTAQHIADLLDVAIADGPSAAAQAYLRSERVVALPVARAASTSACLILGAGPTGLSAAYHFGEGSTLVERLPRVGGWCRSIEDGGFQFDYAGHIMFSNDAYVLDLYQRLLGDNLHWQDREAWVYSKNVYTRYPFQGALYGLPPQVLKECLIGAIEARYVASATPAASADNVVGMPQCAASGEHAPVDCCADGVAGDVPAKEHSDLAGTRGAGQGTTPRNFEEFIYRVWGAGVARHFAIPYNRKLWTVPLSEMETSWLGGRVPLPNLEEMIEGALQPVPKPMGPNARFGYPLRGGFQALMDGFLPHLRGDVVLDAEVVRVDPQRRSVTLADGRQLGYDNLISTLPLPKLVAAIGSAAPAEIHAAAAGLRHVSIRCVNLGIGRPGLTDKHWIYYPEDSVFHRIFVQGNASPHCNAPGGFGLTCEISYAADKPLPAQGQALIDLCIRDCIRVGIIAADDPVWVANEVDMPYAYVIYDHTRERRVALIRQWLLDRGIVLAGRYSEWEYYNSDHAFLAGKKAAEKVRALQTADAVRSA